MVVTDLESIVTIGDSVLACLAGIRLSINHLRVWGD
jgi:hypothetical protein